MSQEIIETLVRKAFEEAEESVSFSFQGGEPTLAGLEFFKNFINLVSIYKKLKIGVHFSIQTNGTKLDTQWCDFFRNYNFLVGLSLDGLQKFHDSARRDTQGNPTYQVVTSSYHMLRGKKVDVNILCVVTGRMTRLGERVYKELKQMGCHHIQFIPCLDPVGAPKGDTSFSLSPESYSYFLKTIFDLWYKDWRNGSYCSIRLFDDHVRILAGLEPSSCATAGRCGNYAVVESDGSIFPCDFYVVNEWKIGNITKSSFAEILESSTAVEFIQHSQRPAKCSVCKWSSICRGGCKKDWVFTESGVENYYCQTFKDFFEYAYNRLKIVAEAERYAQKTVGYYN